MDTTLWYRFGFPSGFATPNDADWVYCGTTEEKDSQLFCFREWGSGLYFIASTAVNSNYGFDCWQMIHAGLPGSLHQVRLQGVRDRAPLPEGFLYQAKKANTNDNEYHIYEETMRFTELVSEGDDQRVVRWMKTGGNTQIVKLSKVRLISADELKRLRKLPVQP